MPVEIHCPSCQEKFRVPDSLSGKSVRCRSCGEVFPTGADEGDPPAGPRRKPRREPDRPKTAASTWGVLALVVALALVGGAIYLARQAEQGRQAQQALESQQARQQPQPPAPKTAAQLLAELEQKEKSVKANREAELERQRLARVREEQRLREEAQSKEDETRDWPTGISRMPKYPTEVKPVAAPELPDGRLTVPLPNFVIEAVVGGAGRYYLLRLRDESLVVFDLSEAKVVKTFAAGHCEDVALAAGLDHFYLLSKKTKVLDRWSFQEMARVDSKAVPLQHKAVAMALGCAAHGPLLIAGADLPTVSETMFFDPVKMAPYEMPFDAHRFFNSSLGSVLRASANGETFVLFSTHPHGSQVYHVRHPTRKPATHPGSDFLPDAEGQRIYTRLGAYPLDMKNPNKGVPADAIPAHDGPLLVVPPAKQNPGQIRILSADGAVAEEVSLANAPTRDTVGALPGHSRYHLVASARTLVVFPQGNQIVLVRVKGTPG